MSFHPSTCIPYWYSSAICFFHLLYFCLYFFKAIFNTKTWICYLYTFKMFVWKMTHVTLTVVLREAVHHCPWASMSFLAECDRQQGFSSPDTRTFCSMSHNQLLWSKWPVCAYHAVACFPMEDCLFAPVWCIQWVHGSAGAHHATL